MLAIVDYQMGNLRSVQKAFEKVGATAKVVSQPDQVSKADRLVLPGVGAFRDAIGLLRESGLDQAVKEFADSGKPLLGICLGMQLLFQSSKEGGEFQGLGIVPGEVLPFDIDPELKIPHMGWNHAAVSAGCESKVLGAGQKQDLDSSNDPFFYFVHSFYCRPSDRSWVGLETDYGGTFCSAVAKDNIVATQFHPEKSQSSGLELLSRFASWEC